MNNLRNSLGESKGGNGPRAESRRSRFDQFNDFIDCGQSHLRKVGCASAVTLWVTLWRFENATTGLTRVGVRALAESCYGSPDDTKSVRRMLAQLESHGFLEVVDPGKPGRGSCAVYRLHGRPMIGGVVPPIAPAEKWGTVPPIVQEKGAREPVIGGVVPPVQKYTEKKSAAPPHEPVEDAHTEEKTNPPGEQVEGCQDAIAFWIRARREKYGVERGLSKADTDRVRSVMGALGGDVEQFKAAVTRYLACTKAYEVDARHSLALFARQFDRWLLDTPSVLQSGETFALESPSNPRVNVASLPWQSERIPLEECPGLTVSHQGAEAGAFWRSSWCAKYGNEAESAPIATAQKIAAIMKRMGGDIDLFKAAVGRFLACDEEFEVRARHSLALFAKQCDRWLTDMPAVVRPPFGYDRGAAMDNRVAAQLVEALAGCDLDPEPRASIMLPPGPSVPPTARVPVPRGLADPEFRELWAAIVADPRNADVPAGDAAAKLEALAFAGSEKALVLLR